MGDGKAVPFHVQASLTRRLVPGKAIAAAPYSLDQRVMARGFERRAQAANMHIDGSLLDEHMIAPDEVEQLGTAVDALGVGHEKLQQAEFRRPHRQRFSMAGDATVSYTHL